MVIRETDRRISGVIGTLIVFEGSSCVASLGSTAMPKPCATDCKTTEYELRVPVTRGEIPACSQRINCCFDVIQGH